MRSSTPDSPRTNASVPVALHAISLCAIFELDIGLDQATQTIQQAAQDKERFVWLTPPTSMGPMTIADIYPAQGPQEHARLVRQWAESAWSAWSEHHPTFRRWLSGSFVL